MSGVELRNGTLVVGREPNQLDELAVAFSEILGQSDIRHVYIASYVSVLAGRARSTEDVDVLQEIIWRKRRGRTAPSGIRTLVLAVRGQLDQPVNPLSEIANLRPTPVLGRNSGNST